MKAGAFGRQRERGPVQPGGRVLPGMFAGAGTAAGSVGTATSSSPPPLRAGTRSPPAAKADAVLSRFGSGGGQGSGRFSNTSRLDRPVERVAEAAETTTTSRPVGDSISRARRLGLNRAARTPSPEPDPPQSPMSSDVEDEENEPAAHAFMRSPQRRHDGEDDGSRPATRAASSRPAEAATDPEPQGPPTEPSEEANRAPPRPLPGLLSSLWNRASELVGGAAPASTRENEAGEEDATERQREVDDHAQKDTSAGEEEEEGDEMPPTARTKNATRPILVPALVAPALTGTRASSATRTVSAPVVPAGPPPEPITYHRPPALHQRSMSPEIQRFRSQPSPYDWLDSRDESPIIPYMFLPTAAQADAMAARMRSKAAAAQATQPSQHWPAAAPHMQPYPPVMAAPHLSSSTNYPPTGTTTPHHLAISAAGGAATLIIGSQAPFAPQQPSAGLRVAGASAIGPEGATPIIPPLVQPASLPVALPAIRSQPPPSSVIAPVAAPAIALPAAADPAPGVAAFQNSVAVPTSFVPPTMPQGMSPTAPLGVSSEPLPRYSESELPSHVAPYVDEWAPATLPAGAPPDRATQTSSGPPALAPAPALVNLRAGNGDDSLPVHPSPAEITPPVPAPRPAPLGQAAYALAPMSLAQSGAPQAVGPAAIAPPLATTAAAVQPNPLPMTSAPPPLVAPAVLSYGSAPQIAPSLSATTAPVGGGVNSGLPDFGPLDVLKVAVRNAVLCDDVPKAAGHSASLPQQGSFSRAGPTGGIQAMGIQGEGDLPPMPRLRPIPVTPPPPAPPAQIAPPSLISPTSKSCLTAGCKPPTSRSATSFASRSEDASSRAGIHNGSTSTALGRITHTSSTSPSPDHTLGRVSSIEHARIGASEGSFAPTTSAVSQTTTAQVAQPGAYHTLPVDDWTSAAISPAVNSSNATSSVAAPAQLSPSPAPTSEIRRPTPAPVSPPSQSTLLPPPPVPARPASIPPLPRETSPDSRLAGLDAVDGSPARQSNEATVGQALALPDAEDAEDGRPDTTPIQPKLELETLDLDFGDFGTSFSLTTPTVVAAAGAHKALNGVMLAAETAPHRNDGRGNVLTSSEHHALDALDRAFDETASFVADFAHATLERARIDPNHTERTERWLEQTGVRAQPMSGLTFVLSSYRPMTAPPASVAPGLLQLTLSVEPAVPAVHRQSAPDSAAFSAPSSPNSAPALRMPIVNTCTYLPSASSGPSSPLETAISARSAEETTLARGRPVAPNSEARERDRLAAVVSSGQVNMAASPQVRAETDLAGAQARGATANSGSAGARLPPALDFEPLVGDKGETASEVAAMFGNW
ncbi:hypothetical protein BMF94_3476 [Rhodotorula taiwanensis]|uniref:Uncharacterized protein n=1 Tax=Rhodotorula taiwanensis TaxID=741276 RepID=A0A2S5B9U1_9BASI|nr:hypothetical protein BMF94_3476 [Rhodotorula taiwanensis]